ncbi:MAG TPA: protein YgfX [Paraburkholderia sp.]
MRRSALLYGASAGFILIAVAAVCTALVPHMAPAQLAVAALATLGVLCAALARDERSRPVALKSGPDGLLAWNRAGELIVQGRVAGGAQWSGWLLTLALVSDNGHSRTLLIAADMLPADLFRELAVQARRAGQA